MSVQFTDVALTDGFASRFHLGLKQTIQGDPFNKWVH